MINISNSAKNRIKELISNSTNQNLKLRIYIEGSGCSGLEYCFAFEEQETFDDFLINEDGVTVIIDPISLPYLKGAVLDYVTSLSESKFVINNPNAKSTCGCGASFCPNEELI